MLPLKLLVDSDSNFCLIHCSSFFHCNYNVAFNVTTIWIG